MINRLPEWLRQDIPDAGVLEKARLLRRRSLNTVCREAKCPNLSRCFKDSRLTFMILGATCTRNCGFCNVNKLQAGERLGLIADEPLKISRLVRKLGIRYAVITSVTRDDLADGGATQFAMTIRAIHALNRRVNVEALIPDFSGNAGALKTVVEAAPSVMAHNIETVRRLYKQVRQGADYFRSLDILSRIKRLNPSLVTKSSVLLGMGEAAEEVVESMRDLRKSGCDALTLGQYLAPSPDHYPVREFIEPEQFQRYRSIALAFGFRAVLSGPLVRSSYAAEEVYEECMMS